MPSSFEGPLAEVDLAPPDLSPWRAGNTGIPGFVTLAGPLPGPHLGIVSLIHGNEFAGAIALDRLLQHGVSPLRGRLTAGFANLDAFDRFDPSQPTASRFIDEDLNRLWDPAALRQEHPDTVERRRARQMLPLIERFDLLLDLHSMLWPADPVILAPRTGHGTDLAARIASPYSVVSDPGHATGPRLIDHPHFSGSAQACLLEAGPHWQPETVAVAERAILNLLAALRMTGPPPPSARWPLPPPRSGVAPPFRAEVTATVTARTKAFAFQDAYRGGVIVPRAGTLIARDGDAEIRTPYDSCLLIMPSLRPSPGHTAVRLARIVAQGVP